LSVEVDPSNKFFEHRGEASESSKDIPTKLFERETRRRKGPEPFAGGFDRTTMQLVGVIFAANVYSNALIALLVHRRCADAFGTLESGPNGRSSCSAMRSNAPASAVVPVSPDGAAAREAASEDAASID